MKTRKHEVTIVVNGRQVAGWTEYTIETSLVEPADSFTLRRPFDRDAWETCRRDARVRVQIDGLPRIDGFIDARRWVLRDGTMEISGRDRCGRLVQESAPRSAFSGKTVVEIVEQVAKPWFDKVTLSNARNRRITLGKGTKAPAFEEPVQVLKKAPKNGRIDPGQPKWEVIEQLLSRAGLIAWSSADGKELFVGKPNHAQPALWKLRHSARSPVGSAIEIDYEESNADRYSMIVAVGAGNNSAADYGGNATTRAGYVFDNDDAPDGTGRDFQFPKRLVLGERALRDSDEASRVAAREQLRRDFKRTHVSATVPHHGQLIAGTTLTLFATDTVASLIIEDEEGRVVVDDDFLIYALTFTGSREGGETTRLEMVPRGTEIVL